MRPQTLTHAELLQKAAVCYLSVNLQDDACRCYQNMGEYTASARLHKQAGRLTQAAKYFELAKEWRDAAQCWLEGEEPLRAANAFYNAKDIPDAAWLLAHQHQIHRARPLAERHKPKEPWETLGLRIILARCHAGSKQQKEAFNILQCLAPETEPDLNFYQKQKLTQWYRATAQYLGRFDLIALSHARGLDHPKAVDQWRDWAAATLGDASGIPLQLQKEQP